VRSLPAFAICLKFPAQKGLKDLDATQQDWVVERCADLGDRSVQLLQKLMETYAPTHTQTDLLALLTQEGGSSGFKPVAEGVPPLYLELGLWRRLAKLNKQMLKRVRALERTSSASADAPEPATDGADVKKEDEPVDAFDEESIKRRDAHTEKTFRDWYMEEFTSAFGDELDAIRQEEHFDANSVGVLVGAIEAGMAVVPLLEKRITVARLQGGKKPSKASRS